MILFLFLLILTALAQIIYPKAINNEVHTLASRQFSLENRHEVRTVNDVFKDNILLTIHYTVGKKINPRQIDWQQIKKPFQSPLVLAPGETFAFHDDVLPQYQGKVVKTTNAHFNSSEGFKSDGYLVGDGVCHLASLLYRVAKEAGLKTLAPTRHDFAPIPDVPPEFGVSIYDYPLKSEKDKRQNLYISNTKNKPITFQFDYDGKILAIRVLH